MEKKFFLYGAYFTDIEGTEYAVMLHALDEEDVIVCLKDGYGIVSNVRVVGYNDIGVGVLHTLLKKNKGE